VRLEATIRAELERLVAGRREGEALLLILPEYTNAFYAVLPLLEELEDEPASWKEVLALHAQESGGDGLPVYLRRRASEVRRWMDAFYGGFAAEHRLWLLAGSYFAVHEGELRNRAVLYGPSGTASYEQDKVYLTPFERQELSLSPGKRAAARIFRVAGLRCALTICRDSFFSAWEEQLAGAELWIDLKANGAPWTAETRRLFTRALPERIARGGVPWGVTVTLTGRLFGLLWEGPSSLVHFEPDAPKGWIVLWEARKLRSGTSSLLRLPRNPGEAGEAGEAGEGDQPPRW
jgi:predicted amidohydrolase